MKDKDLNYIAAVEKAISEKYGEETVINPKSNWDEEKEKNYLNQMKDFYGKIKKNEQHQEKVDINGIKVSKKLLNKEPRKNCPVCGKFPKQSMDDVCLLKFECCHSCYVQYVEDREERWLKGWRPKNGNSI
jgi:hypothetical protein